MDGFTLVEKIYASESGFVLSRHHDVQFWPDIAGDGRALPGAGRLRLLVKAHPAIGTAWRSHSPRAQRGEDKKAQLPLVTRYTVHDAGAPPPSR